MTLVDEIFPLVLLVSKLEKAKLEILFKTYMTWEYIHRCIHILNLSEYKKGVIFPYLQIEY